MILLQLMIGRRWVVNFNNLLILADVVVKYLHDKLEDFCYFASQVIPFPLEEREFSLPRRDFSSLISEKQKEIQRDRWFFVKSCFLIYFVKPRKELVRREGKSGIVRMSQDMGPEAPLKKVLETNKVVKIEKSRKYKNYRSIMSPKSIIQSRLKYRLFEWETRMARKARRRSRSVRGRRSHWRRAGTNWGALKDMLPGLYCQIFWI